jgi:hypothetical protein
MKKQTYKKLVCSIMLSFIVLLLSAAQSRQLSTFTYDKTGQLTLENVVDNYWCMYVYDNVGNLLRKISFSEIDPIKIYENESTNTIILYPNPATETIHILYKEIAEDTIFVEIVNMQGSVVLQQEIEITDKQLSMIDISKLSRGHYYLRINNVKNAASAIFIKL